MRAYSMDLRVRVLADGDAGMTTSAVADNYSVSPAWVRRLQQRRAAGLGIEPLAGRPGRKPSLLPGADADRLRQLANAQPDLSAPEYRTRFTRPISIPYFAPAAKPTNPRIAAPTNAPVIAPSSAPRSDPRTIP